MNAVADMLRPNRLLAARLAAGSLTVAMLEAAVLPAPEQPFVFDRIYGRLPKGVVTVANAPVLTTRGSARARLWPADQAETKRVRAASIAAETAIRR
jgi:hypothetical protein